MEFNTFAASRSDLEKCKSLGIVEVLIAPASLSRTGKISIEHAEHLLAEAKELGLSPVLVWDALMPEKELGDCLKRLEDSNIWKNASAVRVQDLGALNWILETQANLPIHFIAETANVNLLALKRWEEIIGARLSRIILSQQLTEEKIIEFVSSLKTPCEVLGAGPILLFYSPRSLLSSKLGHEEVNDQWLMAVSSSEESHHREFPTVENQHGTFMYLNKDQFILDKLEKISAAGLAFVRIDLQFYSDEPNSTDGLEEIISAIKNDPGSVKSHWPVASFAPFFRNNNTTRQFSKLKPSIHSFRNQSCVARVLMGDKPKRMILWAMRDFVPGAQYELLLPNGSRIENLNLEFNDLTGNSLKSCVEDQVLFTSWVKSSCVGALLLEQKEV